ncbi:hypothetical protein [Salinibacterium sp. ZJ454]|uniref:hypothetical protein n=1 Tax=Salinibacterium sp. ZJ454 TaxID=2708339 RepID=UPI00141FB3F2|nr:hypothetical protein [Salinibacterium sp. ZJ454]
MPTAFKLIEVSETGVVGDSAAMPLAAASRIGTPVALVVAPESAAESLRAELAAWGAETVVFVPRSESPRLLVTPQVAALVAAAQELGATAVLGREAVARAAVRLGAALLVDAVVILFAASIAATAATVLLARPIILRPIAALFGKVGR